MSYSSLPVARDVSRETLQRLDTYEALLRQWNTKINLVSQTTLDELEKRHIADSAQLFDYIPHNAEHLADFGTGGGFPGIVLAILCAEHHPQLNVTLIESDKRKATFLRTVKREVGLNTSILTTRVEENEPLGADVITARALAPLKTLFGLCKPHLTDAGRCLFLKGQKWKKEVEDARIQWIFDARIHKSVTDPSAVILDVPTYHHV